MLRRVGVDPGTLTLQLGARISDQQLSRMYGYWPVNDHNQLEAGPFSQGEIVEPTAADRIADALEVIARAHEESVTASRVSAYAFVGLAALTAIGLVVGALRRPGFGCGS